MLMAIKMPTKAAPSELPTRPTADLAAEADELAARFASLLRLAPFSGAGELAATWQDPSFNPDERAFYYVRALENPTCRWSSWDAIRNGSKPRADLPVTIQERVWSSPIWYVPSA